MQPDPTPETTQAPEAPAPETARPVNRALVSQVKRDLERLAGKLEERISAAGYADARVAVLAAHIHRAAEILGDALGPRVNVLALSGYAPHKDPTHFGYDMQIPSGAHVHAGLERIGDPADRMHGGSAYVVNCRGICWHCAFTFSGLPAFAARRLMQRVGIELRVIYNHRSAQRRKAAARKDAARRAEIIAAREEVAG